MVMADDHRSEKKLKAVHFVTSAAGGAARAAVRIAEAERRVGIDAVMLYAEGNTEAESTAWRWKDRLKLKLYNKLNHRLIKKSVKGGQPVRYFSPDQYGFDISKLPVVQQADVVHLHWVSDGMLSPKALEGLASMEKKVVWTLHDQRPYTGGCHYAEGCTRYKKMCGNCPVFQAGYSEKVLSSTEDEPGSVARDLSSKCQDTMRQAVKNLDLTVVGCSRWITDCAAESSVLHGKTCINIPNPIDTELFDVQDRKTVRELLGLSQDKKLILFGAENSDSDRRKGYAELLAALKELPSDQYSCVVFGNSREIREEIEMEVISLGYIRDDFHLKCVYNACDVFVSPSLYENLANTVMESLSCGTPVTAFNIGGMADMIRHGENGYLAENGDSADLAAGIRFCAEHDLRENARKTVINNFSPEIIGEKYKKLYCETNGRQNKGF
ncbi:Glycosyltransferase involved in cell wall bisynthesis [Lachnospiraceae bacterium]|nr:Glycosyltransferase involved in cell wall bisynthesis [Lachnospiraceae bacterium]